jgi:excisionase family DNA binding protein
MDKIIITTPAELESLINDSVRKAISEQNGITQTKTDNSPQLLTVEQACEFLNLAKQTLYGFTSKRLIPFLKRGKKLYFKKTELEEWVNIGKHKSLDELQKESNRR